MLVIGHDCEQEETLLINTITHLRVLGLVQHRLHNLMERNYVLIWLGALQWFLWGNRSWSPVPLTGGGNSANNEVEG